MQEHIFERMARERNISVEEMRAIISDRIEKGWNDKDPVKREQWRKIPCAGEIPTPDEWLSYVIKKIKDDGQGNLLRKYLDSVYMRLSQNSQPNSDTPDMNSRKER